MSNVTRAAKTHAQASRERRDIVSGEVLGEARLIRFVAGPDGAVVPDLARKLPGRGLWVAADRASVATAAKKTAPRTAAASCCAWPATRHRPPACSACSARPNWVWP